MTASNWAVCPRCRDNAVKAIEEQKAAVQASYGKVPAEEFTAAMAALPAEPADVGETFREDYEIFGASSGTITVDYSGNCQECGLNLDFTTKEPFYPIEKTDHDS